MTVLTKVFTFWIADRMPPVVLHPGLLLLSYSGRGKHHGPVEEHCWEDQDDVDDSQDRAYPANLEIQMYSFIMAIIHILIKPNEENSLHILALLRYFEEEIL